MITVGGVNVVEATINNELRVAVLEKVVDRLLQVVPPASVTPADVERFRKEALLELQKKYPQAGIQVK